MVGHVRIGKQADSDITPAVPQDLTPFDGSVDDSPPDVENIAGDASTSDNVTAEIGDDKHNSLEGEHHTSVHIELTHTQP